MIAGTDRPPPAARSGQSDCLVEIATAWFRQPLGGQTQQERAEAITEICLVIAQMRHREAAAMEFVRARWVERVTVRLCTERGVLTADPRAIQVELGKRVLEQLLRYHEWREQIAPVQRPTARPGLSHGGSADVRRQT